jgi:hypothetical protein
MMCSKALLAELMDAVQCMISIICQYISWYQVVNHCWPGTLFAASTHSGCTVSVSMTQYFGQKWMNVKLKSRHWSCDLDVSLQGGGQRGVKSNTGALETTLVWWLTCLRSEKLHCLVLQAYMNGLLHAVICLVITRLLITWTKYQTTSVARSLNGMHRSFCYCLPQEVLLCSRPDFKPSQLYWCCDLW